MPLEHRCLKQMISLEPGQEIEIPFEGRKYKAVALSVRQQQKLSSERRRIFDDITKSGDIDGYEAAIETFKHAMPHLCDSDFESYLDTVDIEAIGFIIRFLLRELTDEDKKKFALQATSDQENCAKGV